MALTTSSSDANSQGSTQNPQTASGSSNGNNGSLQPGVAASQLVGGTGVSVSSPVLSGVPLGVTSQTSTSTGSGTSDVTTHHPQPVLLGVSLGLLVVAVVLFWTTGRSAKNTTKYL